MRKIAAIVALSLSLCLPVPSRAASSPLHIGALIYNGTDAFMTSVFENITREAQGAVDITILDSQNMQSLQNEQLEQLLDAHVDALIVNAVDRTAIVYLIRKIMPRGIPVIFINREPLHEDMALYDKAYYVGSDPKQSGAMCGEIAAEYFARETAADKNGDGIIQYVLLKGEPGHQDAELRTKHSVRAMESAGFRLEKLAEDTGLWERAKAKDIMAGFLQSFGERIECVIANNDEMALGAIEALKATGYYADGRFMPVVGVDATEPAISAIREGTLLGTVLNDSISLADAALQLAMLLACGEAVTEENFHYTIDKDRYVFTESRKITAPIAP